jgi:uncharacterized phiE125 gp8 family phage protein
MKVELVTPPSDAAILGLVSVADMKRELRLTSTAQDLAIEEKIYEAYRWLDGPNGILNRSILPQTLRYHLNDIFGAIELSYPPIRSITTVEYQNTLGVWTSVPLTNFELDLNASPAVIGINYDYTWPITSQTRQIARVTAATGYTDAADVKLRMRNVITLIKMMAAHLFHNREATVQLDRNIQAIQALPFGIRTFVTRLRIPNDHS